jgi:hypothetical protein
MRGLFTFSCLLACAVAFGQIQNASFEDWDTENPTGWETGNGGTAITANVTDDAHTGTNAAELTVLVGDGFIIPGLLGQTITTLSFTPTTLTFWMESAFEGNSGLTVAATIFDAEGNVISFGVQTILENYDSYTQVELPITPLQVGIPAASGYITLYLSNEEAGLTPEANSIARIDDVTFDGLPVEIAEATTSPTTSLYPNPVEGDVVYLNCSTEEIVSLKVVDLQGKLLDVNLQTVAESTNSAKVDVSHLSAGNYFILLEKSNTLETLRLQKK